MSDVMVTAREAADLLGVSKETLYAYVSRGHLQSFPRQSGSRERMYRKAELMELQHRRSFRRDPESAASGVIEFGTPILTTAISMVTDDEHGYRGIPSRELAARYRFEQVCDFLWTGSRTSLGLPTRNAAWDDAIDAALIPEVPDLTPVERMQVLLPYLERQSLHAYGARVENLLPSAIRIVQYLTSVSAGRRFETGVSDTLAAAWHVDAAPLDTLLTMVADHELNIATFTARCAASAGASLHQAVIAGLASLQGYKHLFGQVMEARTFFQEVLETGDPERIVRRYLQRRSPIPGFHNPYRSLYPERDPRVATLLDNLADRPGTDLLNETVELVVTGTRENPRIDFALGVTEPLLGLPRDSIFSLIATGRTAGIIAHVLEQFSSDRVIRPRARYTGAVAAAHGST